MSYRPGDMHVIWREDIQHWCARSLDGDWGISHHKTKAIAVAIDGVITSGRFKRLVIHHKSGDIEQVLTRFTGTPSSQAFQDDVP